MSLTASQLVSAQAKIWDYWKEPNPAVVEFLTTADTAGLLMKRQTARMSPIQNGKRTIGFDVKWLKSGVNSIIHDATSLPAGLDCTLENGTALDSDSKTYTDNMFIVSAVSFNDQDVEQKNLFTIDEIIAQTLMKGMADLRQKINLRAINFLNANKQQNLDTLVSDSDLSGTPWAVNADGATIEFPVADAKNEDAISELKVILKNNGFKGEWLLLNGRHNWRLLRDVAPFKALNDDQRSIQGALRSFNMSWDEIDMDTTLGGRNSFAVDPNSYIFINRSYSSLVPVQKSPTQWEYYVEDPILMVNENGRLRPFRYEVIYQRVCSDRNSDSSLSFDHQFELKALGQIHTSPDGINGETGMMRIKAV
jgi:hypothetical protein